MFDLLKDVEGKLSEEIGTGLMAALAQRGITFETSEEFISFTRKRITRTELHVAAYTDDIIYTFYLDRDDAKGVEGERIISYTQDYSIDLMTNRLVLTINFKP